jgi:hypothetical protein
MTRHARLRATPTEATLLVKVARHPNGLSLPTRSLRSVATCLTAGWLSTSLDDYVLHITPAGWRAMGPGRQEEVRRDALAEHAARQGPADEHELRRLITAFDLTHRRARLLRNRGWTAAADAVSAEAELLLARLAVLTRKPVTYTPAVIIIDAAGSLRRLLSDMSLAEGHPATVDPRYRYDAQGIDLWDGRDPWKASRAEVAAALLES